MTVRLTGVSDVEGAVALQRACFPPPFPEEFLWRAEHLLRHISLFPQGQLFAIEDSKVVGAATSCMISDDTWQAHRSWNDTVGGPFLERHDPEGTTLYGLDISVHPGWRGRGIGRALYEARFDWVDSASLVRYGTGCRLPGFLTWSRQHQPAPSVENYTKAVVAGTAADRTFTPLLRYGLRFLGVIHDYMPDEESANAAALLKWKP